ncbi:hypothetical protein L917_01029 [Phytophthora nicotianae]|uniref:Uncharacterized protein n=1 Tax=Phytophthora nicotianae TaxID=4792 RepID=W2LYE9_PHYNI|nr:hypothetical protein L917_01029 [Phytophthora nicotianae]
MIWAWLANWASLSCSAPSPCWVLRPLSWPSRSS